MLAEQQRLVVVRIISISCTASVPSCSCCSAALGAELPPAAAILPCIAVHGLTDSGCSPFPRAPSFRILIVCCIIVALIVLVRAALLNG